MERKFGSPVTQVAGGNSWPDAVAVTKSDVTVYSPELAALFVGGAGDVNVVTVGGQTTKFVGVLANTLLPVRVTQVLSTGTSATNIVGLY